MGSDAHDGRLSLADSSTWTFSPSVFLKPLSLSSLDNAKLLILNQPLNDIPSFERIWSHTNYRICADGGAQRLSKLVTDAGRSLADFVPDEIHGDLDSVSENVQRAYARLGVRISRDTDQYSTDFGKVMNRFKALDSEEQQPDIVILGSIAGRVDHGLGLLHELYRETLHEVPSRDGLRLWLVSESNVSFILRPGSNVIMDVNPGDGVFTEKVGILPIYGPATITTLGLGWNVKDWGTEMGGKVSTSNHVVGDVVRIKTDHYVLFTIERILQEG